MPAIDAPPAQTLRQALRIATSAQHDRLDGRVTAMDLTDPGDYGRFLSMQLMARAPIEAWLADRLPDAPPPACALIAADLAALGVAAPAGVLSLGLPADADPIGACWAIAGSSLGNRSMLARVAKSGKADDLPTAFLADETMTGYWRTLKPRLEAPAGDSRGAIAAAEMVFATFLAAAEACLAPSARQAA